MRGVIERAWSRDTSADPSHWTTDNPALGQCAVTALLVQELLGGDLLRTENEGVSHYWNRVGGYEIDLTRVQFTNWNPVDISIRERSYLVSYPETARRFEVLRERFIAHLAERAL